MAYAWAVVVKNSSTNEPIEGASVYFDKTGVTVYTGSNGLAVQAASYAFDQCNVDISCDGYYTRYGEVIESAYYSGNPLSIAEEIEIDPMTQYYPGSTGVSESDMIIKYPTSSATRTISGNTNTVSVSSNNTSVATVSRSGSTITVTRRGYGTATITCSVEKNGSYSAETSYFTVYCEQGDTELTIDAQTTSYPTPAKFRAKASTSGTLYWGTSESGMTNSKSISTTFTEVTSQTTVGSKTIYYYFTPTSSNYKGIGIDDDTITVGKGSCPVTVSTSDMTITYDDTTGTRSVSNYSTTGVGTISVSTGSSSIATVSYSSGTITVTRRGYGSTTITVSVAEGTYYYGTSFQFTVNCNRASISPSISCSDSVNIGSTITATVTGNSGNGSVTWSSSNTSVARISSSGVITGVSGGSTTITASIAQSTNYLAGSATKQVTVNSMLDQSAPTAYGDSVAYPSTATATASGGGGHGSLEWYNGNTLSGNAGSSKTTKARWAGNSSYNPSPWSNEVTLSITVGNQSAPTVYSYSDEYGNTVSGYATGSGVGTLKYKKDTSGGTSYGTSSTTVPSRTTIGTTTYIAYYDSTTNYNASPNSNQGSLTITKASQSAPTATGSSVTYGSTATASASGGGGYGSIEWYNGSTRTAVGSQTTKARWSGNTYYEASPWSNEVTLTVTQASQSTAPTAYGASVTYPSTATATTSGSGYGGVEWSNGNTLSTVGSKTTKARFAGNTNYAPSPWSNEVTLSVSKGTPTFYVYGDTVEYGNTAYSTVYTSTAGTVYWGTSSRTSGMTNSKSVSSGTTTLTNRSSIGSTTVYAYFVPSDSNYNNVGSSSSAGDYGTITVTKASQSAPTATGSSVTYGSTATASASGGGGYGSIEWYNGSTRTAVGSQTTKARWTGDSYRDASPWSNEVTLSVSKASQSAPTAYGDSVTYPGTATATASGGGGQGTLTWTNGNTRTEVGSQTTKAYWSGNSNYNASGYSNEVTITVNKATNLLTISPTSNTIYDRSGYNTFTITPSNAQGSVSYSSSNTAVATVNSSGVVTYVGSGSCTITVTAAGNDYYNSGSKTCSVTCIVDSVSSLSISVTNNSINYNETTTISVTATYVSGYSADVTSSTTFSTDPTGIITIT